VPPDCGGNDSGFDDLRDCAGRPGTLEKGGLSVAPRPEAVSLSAVGRLLRQGLGFNVDLPAPTRRNPEAATNHSGDVRVGTIAIRTGSWSFIFDFSARVFLV